MRWGCGIGLRGQVIERGQNSRSPRPHILKERILRDFPTAIAFCIVIRFLNVTIASITQFTPIIITGVLALAV